MQTETLYWLIFMLSLFVTMFILVPPAEGPKLAPFGFWMGLVQAIVILWLGQSFFRFFRVIGDPTLMGIPVITSVSWIPLAILFAKFFQLADTTIKKIGLVLAFAAGAGIGQHLLSILGLWQNIRWNWFFTFLLGIVTHSVMTYYITLKKQKYLR